MGSRVVVWFKVDDSLAFHRKTVTAGNAAMGLWVRAGAWASQTLNDGHIPTDVARQMGTKAQADRLVMVGLWVEDGDGYRFHQWGERNPLREAVLEGRKRNAEKLANWRKGKGDKS